eukprot:CAMPEP_0175087440 /NCGR_PEP_ID=MMETSP0052_2-20121109/29831_1 /TAXON_ID=51329 ORGANISM="Polytomella parva, Strain SAG 63-3" /NCGR_SAMPLE_ID=MMETSP0052_2 /ASSEMBLY_ACC=CAM_ASM_000194 /LENGTH=167 /DNA_ID=CAMNT_0016359785 /DNA_START=192 /DNA_END=692 /DNA_ORIENTATION=+
MTVLQMPGKLAIGGHINDDEIGVSAFTAEERVQRMRNLSGSGIVYPSSFHSSSSLAHSTDFHPLAITPLRIGSNSNSYSNSSNFNNNNSNNNSNSSNNKNNNKSNNNAILSTTSSSLNTMMMMNSLNNIAPSTISNPSGGKKNGKREEKSRISLSRIFSAFRKRRNG